MTLNCDLPPILVKLLTDDKLALDHRLLPGGAAAGAGSGWWRRWRMRGSTFVWMPTVGQLGAAGRTWESGPRAMRRFWKATRGGMMQGACGVLAMLRETSAPSSGARGGRPLFAAFARFAAAEAAKFALCGLVPLSQKSLPSCGDRSHDLTLASHTRSDHQNHSSSLKKMK